MAKILLTNCFLVKRSRRKISKICLAMKKRGAGEGKWNGSGGKVGDEIDAETVEDAVAREVQEELGVQLKSFDKVAVINFLWNQGNDLWVCHVFISDSWEGEPKESEEMSPRWFNVSKIPYSKMWVTDKHWLPLILEGKLLKAEFDFKDEENIKDYQVEVVKALDVL
jgi:ADP-ribose pyrophosphatase YjhB (NUDIX family)